MLVLACLVLLVALGICERVATGRARAAVPIRVHVNGTRGKSTVTRLVAGALREAGVPTLAKVTGTAPRLILPDGSERPIVRRAPASIREQGWLMRRAAREGARAVVAECMAVRPDLQWISEREMVHATIGVITNARLDHTDVMGRTRDEVAQSLANSIPRRGVLIAGDEQLGGLLADRCAAAGTRLVVADEGQVGQACHAEAQSAPASPAERPQVGYDTPWMLENIATALAVTRALGIEDAVAIRGMQKAAPDPGAAGCGTVTIAGRQAAWIDATAANDPESLDLLVTGLKPRAPICIYNHRADRPLRLLAFAQSSDVFRRSAAILLTGDRPSLSLVLRVGRLCAGAKVGVVGRKRLAAAIEQVVDRLGCDPLFVYCGNTRSWARPLWPTNREPNPAARET
jgi:poly-gamma-glutamate synthase PgsB/CapB